MNYNRLFSKVFGWMFLGLLVSFATGMFVASNSNMIFNLYEKGIIWFMIITEFILVVVLSAGINRMSSNVARLLFLFYSFTTGFSLSSVFLVYQLNSIVLVFGITALVFGIFSLIGNYTNRDLTKFGSIVMMALLGVLIASLINLFLGNTLFDIFINAIGIFLFMGITAYDIQKIKLLDGALEEDKVAIIGALELYLDFLNIFLRILQFIGKSKD